MTALSRLVGLCTLAATAGCETKPPEIPTSPSYAKDVKPILDANCTRCHGQGGTLNAGNGPTIGAPTLCYLNMYDDTGDCSTDGGSLDPSCKRGAHFCASPFPDAPTTTYFDVYLFDLTQDEGGMPPLPSPPLSARDKEIVRRWEANPIP